MKNDTMKEREDNSIDVPLCVDLDGTLLRSDILCENIVSILREKPWLLPGIFSQIVKGRPQLKASASRQSLVDHALLPWRKDLLDWLKAQKSMGRRLYLTTAANRKDAETVATQLGIFDGIFASDERNNLKGPGKAAILTGAFGLGGFDYVGDSPADLPVWKAARAGICVTFMSRLLSRYGLQEKVSIRFQTPPATGRTLRAALRVLQWPKNMLVFLPVISSHKWMDAACVRNALGAFVMLCLLSSFAYLVNDMLDIEADRRNAWKRHRPLAAGDLSIPGALLLAIILLFLSAVGTALFPVSPFEIAGLFGLYLAGNFAYSFYLKKQVVLDILCLMGFYLLRVWIGGVVTGIGVSIWLLGFALFIFGSLALLKRYSEMTMHAHAGMETVHRRGYSSNDRQFLLLGGVASALCAMLVLVLYIRSPEVTLLYGRPMVLLLLCPVLAYWLIRLWILAKRNLLKSDPVIFTITDIQTYVVAAVSFGIMFLAT